MIDIYARWGSNNLGDRFQGPGIARLLQARGIEFRALNYRGRSCVDAGAGPIAAVDATAALPQSAAHALALVGSLSVGSDSTRALRRLVEEGHGLRSLVVWSGFQDVYLARADHAPGSWPWLADPRVRFWARSSWDLWLYHRLAGLPEDSTRGRVAGDPMLAWVAGPVRSGSDRVAVVSRYCLEQAPEAWERELARCARVGVFALTTDRHLVDQGLTPIRSPEEFFAFVRGAKILLAGRLHAAILGAAALVPTLGIPWDRRPLGAGSGKMIAVGCTGRPGWQPAFPVRRAQDALPWEPFDWDPLHAEEYLALSRSSIAVLARDLGAVL